MYIKYCINILGIVFCSYSCGYQKAYQDYGNIIHEKYPEITVEGEHYNPPGINMFIAKALVSRRMVCYSVYDNIVILLIEELC
jgi:selT/selW/selH-like putative selenoprotein